MSAICTNVKISRNCSFYHSIYSKQDLTDIDFTQVFSEPRYTNHQQLRMLYTILFKTDTKRGHSCFGVCCDMRQVVVILNIIQMALCLTGMIFFSEVGHVAAGVSTKINDEKVIKFLFFFSFGFLLGGLSAIGAITYNKYFVSYNAVFLLIRFCLTFGFVPFPM